MGWLCAGSGWPHLKIPQVGVCELKMTWKSAPMPVSTGHLRGDTDPPRHEDPDTWSTSPITSKVGEDNLLLAQVGISVVAV